MEKNLTETILDEEFIFDCRRVIYWPKKQVLLAADLHWGKTTFLRQHGIAISDKVFESDLERLGNILTQYHVKTLLVLGDLIHHEKSLSRGVIERVARFRDEHPCELLLVGGNHDRFAQFPDSWGLVEEKDFRLGDFYFTHEFNKKVKSFQFSGHVHPMMRLRSGFDHIRLPSFILAKKFCLLPAFSHLTGGQDMKIQKEQKAIVLLPDGLEVFEK